MSKTIDHRMYTGTPCDECGGPTIQLNGGSIWCGAEDPHPGGHFVKRVAFERSPAKPFKAAKYGAAKPVQPRVIAPPRVVHSVDKAVDKPVDPFAVGMDAFIGEDAK